MITRRQFAGSVALAGRAAGINAATALNGKECNSFVSDSDQLVHRISGWTEQTGIATLRDCLNWERCEKDPALQVRPGGVGRSGAHIMAASSWNLPDWTADPEPLYAAGGHPLAGRTG